MVMNGGWFVIAIPTLGSLLDPLVINGNSPNRLPNVAAIDYPYHF